MITSPSLAKEAIKNLIDIFLKEEKYVRLRQLYDVWSQDDNVADFIIDTLENNRLNLNTDTRSELSFLFSDEETSYGLLNLARSHIYESEFKLKDVMWQKMDDIELAAKPDYYADLIFVRILCRRPVMSILSSYRSDKISRSFGYLIHVHDDFFDTLKESLDDEKSWLFDLCTPEEAYRIKTSIIYALLQHEDKLTESEYRRYFKMYVDVGTKNLETCYNIDILDGRNKAWAKTGADGFLFVMRTMKNIERHTVEYVRGLREALAQDPSMKRGIDLLLAEVQEQIENPAQAELEGLKNSLREAIAGKIEAGELETASMLINEYEDIVGADAPLYSAKGIIHMVNADIDKAESAFLAGLGIEPENADLLYNLGYLNEAQGRYREAVSFYEFALKNSTNQQLISDVEDALTRCRPLRETRAQNQKLGALEESLREKYKL